MDETDIVIPEGVRVSAHEFCAVFPVVAKGSETLAYADGKGIVGKNIDVLIECDDDKYLEAARLASLLRDKGWNNVKIAVPARSGQPS